jgi:hypothetical protein
MKVGDGNNGNVELQSAIIMSFNFTQASTKPIKFCRLGGSQGMGEPWIKELEESNSDLFFKNLA